MAVHQQNRGAVPAMADPQAYLTDINEVEPKAIEHVVILTSAGHRRSGTVKHIMPNLNAQLTTAEGLPPRTERRFARSSEGDRRQAAITHCARVPPRPRDPFGITGDTIVSMAMTLRLADDETDALRRRAELEHKSMQEVARQAIREYVENHSRGELLDQVLDEELPRYAEALERLGQ